MGRIPEDEKPQNKKAVDPPMEDFILFRLEKGV